MEEARTVLARLERIETLDRAHVEPSVLLDELRALVDEAEAWARRERDPRALAAAHVLAERERASPALASGRSPASSRSTTSTANLPDAGYCGCALRGPGSPLSSVLQPHPIRR